MFIIRALSIFVLLIWFPSSDVQANVVWSNDKLRTGPLTRNAKKRFRAVVRTSTKGVSGYLANPITETTIGGKGIHFDGGTFFAAYPDIHDGTPQRRILVLSETGVWAFVRPQPLSRIDGTTARLRARRNVEKAFRILPLTLGKKYRNTVSACSGKKQFKSASSRGLAAKASFGIFEANFGGDEGGEETNEVPAGYKFTRRSFGIEKTSNWVEVHTYLSHPGR